jgi:hypothetical protein
VLYPKHFGLYVTNWSLVLFVVLFCLFISEKHKILRALLVNFGKCIYLCKLSNYQKVLLIPFPVSLHPQHSQTQLLFVFFHHRLHLSVLEFCMSGINALYTLFWKTAFILFYFFNCCAGWGYIVAFTKVLAMYQIYHTWIHPLHLSPSSPPISGTVSTGISFCIYAHVYTLFGPYSSLYPFPCHLSPPTGQPSPRTCSALLFSNFVEEKPWKIKWETRCFASLR